MNALLYLFRKNVINYFKLLKRKPSRLILVIIYIAFFVFILFSSSIPNKTGDYISPNIAISITTLVVLVFLIISMISGVEKMGSSFLMSDVNLIFTSPLRPQTVLLYGFIKQIKTSLVFSLFLIFQLPNLTMRFKLAPYGAFMILFLFMLMQLICSFISVLVYSLVNKNDTLRKNTGYAFKALSLLLVFWSVKSIYFGKDKLLTNAIDFFSGNTFDYFPVIGWFKLMITQCFNGYNKSFILLLSLVIISIGIIITIIYNLNLDFYEDVLSSSEANETLSKMKTSQIDRKNISSETPNRFKMKTRKITSNYSALYSKSIFYRHLLEYRKTGFGMINLYTALLVILTIGFSRFAPSDGIKFLLFFLIYLTVLVNFTAKWYDDLSKHYIFMIPDTPAKKVFYATLGSILKYVVDGTITFTLATILLKANPLEGLLCIITYVSFGFVLTYGGIVNMRLLGVLGSKIFSNILMFVSLFLYILPGIIGAIVISLQFSFLGEFAIYPAFFIWNSIAAFVLLQISKGILDNIESV